MYLSTYLSCICLGIAARYRYLIVVARFHQTKKKKKVKGLSQTASRVVLVLHSGQRSKKICFCSIASAVLSVVVMVMGRLSRSQIWVNIFCFDSTKRDNDAVPLQAATSLFCVLGDKNVHWEPIWGSGTLTFPTFWCDLVPPKILTWLQLSLCQQHQCHWDSS